VASNATQCYDARGRCFATTATVHTRAVRTLGDQHDDKRQHHDERDDPKHLHPAWCAGVSVGVEIRGESAMCVFSPLSRVVVKVIVTAKVSFSPFWPREDYAGYLFAILISAVPKKMRAER
jgi:hypothetical protein